MNGSSLEETIGLDLSDKTGLFVVIDAAGEVVKDDAASGRLRFIPWAVQRARGRD